MYGRIKCVFSVTIVTKRMGLGSLTSDIRCFQGPGPTSSTPGGGPFFSVCPLSLLLVYTALCFPSVFRLACWPKPTSVFVQRQPCLVFVIHGLRKAWQTPSPSWASLEAYYDPRLVFSMASQPLDFLIWVAGESRKGQ